MYYFLIRLYKKATELSIIQIHTNIIPSPIIGHPNVNSIHFGSSTISKNKFFDRLSIKTPTRTKKQPLFSLIVIPLPIDLKAYFQNLNSYLKFLSVKYINILIKEELELTGFHIILSF